MNTKDFIDNYYNIINNLVSYNEIFYKLAVVGEPLITDKIESARVTFNKEGKHLQFLFNPEFLEKLNLKELEFILCHEMKHVLLNHGKRMTNIKDHNRDTANIAMDIIINESLFDNCGFLSTQLPFLTGDFGICRKQNIFKDKSVLDNKTFEYYYNKLLEERDENNGGASGKGLINDHSHLIELSEDELEDLLDEALQDKEKAKQVINKIKDLEEKAFKRSSSGSHIEKIINRFPKIKMSWKDIPKKIRKTRLGMTDTRRYSWEGFDRRANLLSKNLILPVKNKRKDIGKKWDMWLFQDISGSCCSYLDRFVKASRSIPTDVFNVKFHCFNHEVIPVDLNSNNFPSGGGTNFHTIEDYIQKNCGKRYPRLVFIITDGYGNEVTPKYPKNWFWFLTRDNSSRYCHPESKVFDLDNFVSE